VKAPVVAAAATVTLTGTVRLALLLLRVTTEPPVGAAPLSVTVQALVPGPVSAAGLHDSRLAMTLIGALRLMAELALAPLAAAVRVAVESLGIVPAVAEKVVVVAPAAIVVEAGVVSSGLFEEMLTETPPAGAAALAVTVQLLTAPEFSVVGVQTNAVTLTSGVRLNDAVADAPFRLAVSTGVCVLATVPAVAVKAPVVAPAATVTLAGTVRLALLLLSVTTEPPVGAAPLSVTVQALVPGPVKAAGLHESALAVTGGRTATTSPPVAEEAIDMAVGVAADTFVTCTALLRFVPEERTKLPVATTPLRIGLMLRPLSRQV